MPAKKSKYNKNKGIIRGIEFDKGTTAIYEKGILSVNGKKGHAEKKLLSKNIKIEVKENKVVIESKRSTKKDKTIVMTFEAHIKNLLRGVGEGYRYALKICSGHFPMNVSVNNDDFTIKNFLGEKIPRKMKIKNGAAVKVEGDQVIVESLNKEIAGQVSADIENLTRRPGYDPRIFQDGVFIISKPGKETR